MILIGNPSTPIASEELIRKHYTHSRTIVVQYPIQGESLFLYEWLPKSAD